MFKRRKEKTEENVTILIINYLADMEPKKMNRLVQLAKKVRKINQETNTFINGRPDEVDQITKEMENQNG